MKNLKEIKNLKLPGKDPHLVLAVLIILVYVALHFYLVQTGAIDSGMGDDSHRLSRTNVLSQNYFGSFFSLRFFTSHWPYGPDMIQGAFFSFFRLLGLSGTINHIKFALMLTFSFYSASMFVFYLLAAEIKDSRAGLYAIFFFIGTTLLASNSVVTFGEPYALLFLSLGLLYFQKYLDGKRGISAAAVLFTLSAICRNEVVIFAGVIFCYLLFKKRFRDAVLFGLIAFSYFYIKVLVIIATGYKGMTYLNAYKYYNLTERSFSQNWEGLTRMLKAIYGSSYESVFIVMGLLGAAAAAACRKARVYLVIFLSHAAVIFGMYMTAYAAAYPRYLYFVYVFMNLVGAVGLSVATGFAGRFSRRVPQVIFMVLVVLLGFFSSRDAVFAYREHYSSKVPAEIVEARDWLNANLKDDEAIHFDFLAWWENYLRAHTDTVSIVRKTYHFRMSPGLKYYGRSSVDDLPPKEKTTCAAHTHIYNYRPAYLVLAGDAYYERISRGSYPGKDIRYSYIRPYISQGEDPLLIVFQSPYIPPDKYVYGLVFANPMVKIYRLVRVDKAPEGGR